MAIGLRSSKMSLLKNKTTFLSFFSIVIVMVLILMGGLICSHNSAHFFLASGKKFWSTIQNKGVSPVAGYYSDSKTHLYLYGGESSRGYGGVIALAATDEPVINISSYNLSGQLEIDLFKADETSLLRYLLHDEEGNQTQEPPDLTQFEHLVSLQYDLASSSKTSSFTPVPLPLTESGIWYLRVKNSSLEVGSFIIRSKSGIFVTEGDRELIMWGQDLHSKRSITDGEVKIFNLLNGIREEQTNSFNEEGIARINLSADADIAIIKRQDDFSL
ncbi:MAG TPA: hypothetical protein PLM16_02985, partial [Candidatus Woesebacteria bacterium]|nr:hypothetical protein [Candidatus Woesebacteria bacterium]